MQVFDIWVPDDEARSRMKQNMQVDLKASNSPSYYSVLGLWDYVRPDMLLCRHVSQLRFTCLSHRSV